MGGKRSPFFAGVNVKLPYSLEVGTYADGPMEGYLGVCTNFMVARRLAIIAPRWRVDTMCYRAISGEHVEALAGDVKVGDTQVFLVKAAARAAKESELDAAFKLLSAPAAKKPAGGGVGGDAAAAGGGAAAGVTKEAIQTASDKIRASFAELFIINDEDGIDSGMIEVLRAESEYQDLIDNAVVAAAAAAKAKAAAKPADAKAASKPKPSVPAAAKAKPKYIKKTETKAAGYLLYLTQRGNKYFIKGNDYFDETAEKLGHWARPVAGLPEEGNNVKLVCAKHGNKCFRTASSFPHHCHRWGDWLPPRKIYRI
jgi:hypothetical protein